MVVCNSGQPPVTIYLRSALDARQRSRHQMIFSGTTAMRTVLACVSAVGAPCVLSHVTAPTASRPRRPGRSTCPRGLAQLPAWVVVLVAVLRRRATITLSHDTSPASVLLQPGTDAVKNGCRAPEHHGGGTGFPTTWRHNAGSTEVFSLSCPLPSIAATNAMALHPRRFAGGCDPTGRR
jgi:hypothetical protein